MDEKPHVHVLDYDETTGIARREYDAVLRRARPSPISRAPREMMAVVTS